MPLAATTGCDLSPQLMMLRVSGLGVRCLDPKSKVLALLRMGSLLGADLKMCSPRVELLW